jgi:predicted transcriptional regulator
MRKAATTRRTKASVKTAKKKVIAAVEKLPADATIEDAIERLVLLAKIDRGLAEVESGKGVDHSEAKRRLLR